MSFTFRYDVTLEMFPLKKVKETGRSFASLTPSVKMCKKGEGGANFSACSKINVNIN